MNSEYLFTFLENFIFSSQNKIHPGCPQSNKEIGFKLKSVLIRGSRAKSEEIINNLHNSVGAGRLLWSWKCHGLHRKRSNYFFEKKNIFLIPLRPFLDSSEFSKVLKSFKKNQKTSGLPLHFLDNKIYIHIKKTFLLHIDSIQP